MMQTIPATPVAQPHACSAPVSCSTDSNSPCPWTASTWDYDYDELLKAWTAGSRGGPGRVSCSSIESNSSFEDYVVGDVDDNNNNESDHFTANNNHKNASNVAHVSSVTNTNTTTTTPTAGNGDTNNNTTTVTPTAEEEDLTNNNKPNKPEKDTQKEEIRSKNSSPGRTRLLDEDGFIRRAACVCVDETESKVSTRHLCTGREEGGRERRAGVYQ
ncbi:hypothetical protein E2C01_020392 [Portunus trituberculatus]|uniref:Uncharacterized protein n=1 Tax=Portunus trituberculatus TaxID=210409 RepID=A0A5B7E164_PORTR|nr:hypothetical protein [Portunus trituberculatus]